MSIKILYIEPSHPDFEILVGELDKKYYHIKELSRKRPIHLIHILYQRLIDDTVDLEIRYYTREDGLYIDLHRVLTVLSLDEFMYECQHIVDLFGKDYSTGFYDIKSEY